MKCKTMSLFKTFFAAKGEIYLVVIATVITSRVKIYHVSFARKLTWYFTGVIRSHNKRKNFFVRKVSPAKHPQQKDRGETAVFAYKKNGFEIFILQEPGRGFILSSRTCWIDGCTLSYLAGETIPVISGYFLYRHQEDMPKYRRYYAKVLVKRASRLKP